MPVTAWVAGKLLTDTEPETGCVAGKLLTLTLPDTGIGLPMSFETSTEEGKLLTETLPETGWVAGKLLTLIPLGKVTGTGLSELLLIVTDPETG